MQAASKGSIADSTPAAPEGTVSWPYVPPAAPNVRIRTPIKPAARHCRHVGRGIPDLIAQTVKTAPASRPRTETIRNGGSVLMAADTAAGPDPKNK